MLIAVENWKNTRIIMSILFLVDKHHIVLYRKENLVIIYNNISWPAKNFVRLLILRHYFNQCRLNFSLELNSKKASQHYNPFPSKDRIRDFTVPYFLCSAFIQSFSFTPHVHIYTEFFSLPLAAYPPV